jgi:hypothetical protein
VAEETQQERTNRELIELLNELRVALPGVQVLFAFLLTIPFAKGFPKTTALQRHVFFAALAASTLATVLLMAPSAYHRIVFREPDKETLVRHGNVLAIAGIAALGLALCLSLFVVADYVFGGVAAGLAAGITGAVIALFWYALPLWVRLR